jgi:PAS domain S-box-containing protein
MRLSKADKLARQVVFEVSKTLVSALDYDEALHSVLRTMCELLDLQTSSFFQLDADRKHLSCEAFYSKTPCLQFESSTKNTKFPIGVGLPGRTWQSMSPEWIPDVVVDHNFPRSLAARQDGLHSSFAFPVRLGEEFVGVFEFFDPKISKPNKVMLEAFTVVGNELGMFLQRQKMDQELRLQSKRLAASESKFRIFADNVDECLFISAPYLTEHYFVSNAFADIFSYTVEEVYADAGIWATRIAPEDKARVLDYVSRLRGYEMPEPTIEYRIIRPDGSLAWLFVKIFAAVDQQDGSYHICGAVEDVTERKAMEKRLAEFYSLLSHEMKTPLTSIKSVLQIVQDEFRKDLTEEADHLLFLGTKECNRLIRLVDDLLDIKRIEVGKLNLAFERVDADKIAHRTVENLALNARESRVRLSVHVRSKPCVRVDRDRIMQVMTNLVSNAIKYSPANSDVLVGVDTAEGRVRFTVSDNGPGIDSQSQALLFNLFQQVPTDANRQQQGTGVGLAISKAIIDEHGGTIGVESCEGRGATFWFELPED